MAAILLSAAVTCVASLFVGQAVLRLCGAREWSWLAGPVGLAALMLIATPAYSVPGRSLTVAVVVALLTLAAIVWCLRTPAQRPPLAGLLAAAPVALLALVPFAAVGHGGILGTSLDNDMAAHLLFAETYVSTAAEHLHPELVGLYPLGPHASVALIAKGFGIRVDHAFTGWTLALPVLTAWTALALLRRSAWLKQVVIATVVAMPFLVAAYYGQGSFKEVAQTCLVLAVALLLSGYGPRLGRGRWVPLGILAAGTVCIYSSTGIVWPAFFLGLWLAGLLIARIRRRELGGVPAALRAEAPAIALGLAALVLPLLPQAARIGRFIEAGSGGNGIFVPRDVLANLVAPLPGWEAFGVWGNSDYRLPNPSGFLAAVEIAFVVALVLFGAWWALRRGRWMLPLAAAGSLLIWRVSAHSQSPYVVAKALVIASPLLLAVAVLPLAEAVPDRLRSSLGSAFRRGPGRRPPWGLAALLAALLLVVVGLSSLRALRASPVDPTAHADQLRELEPLLHDQPTLFLGNDDYVKWELVPAPVTAAYFSPNFFSPKHEVPVRKGKGWSEGMALDFDLVDAETLNSFRYVITTRDAAASAPPPQLKLVRSTPDYLLWRRDGRVRERSILREEGSAGAVLDCGTAAGRKIVAGGGVAAVLPRPVVVPGPLLFPGQISSISISLAPGRWRLVSSYVSRLAIMVTGPGLDVTLPANLDRSGSRWPIGRVAATAGAPTTLTFHADDPRLAPHLPVSSLGEITAVRDAPERIVPIARACGRYVDWYRSR
jgi:hypothetical protein